MKDLSFTLWMLLYPVAAAVVAYLYEGKLQRRYSETSRSLSVLLDLVTWLAVGYLLYGS